MTSQSKQGPNTLSGGLRTGMATGGGLEPGADAAAGKDGDTSAKDVQPKIVMRPTIGRIVYYWRNPTHAENEQPEAAKVVFVHNDSLVNLRVYDHDGGACGVKNVPLRHPDEGVPNVSYCEWMPYQVGQARAS